MSGPEGSADEPWGTRLRRWRDETQHWSQQDLVDNIVRLAFETSEDRGTRLDTRLVGRWETGAVSRPQAVYRRLLGRLGAPLPKLGPRTRPRFDPSLPGPCPAGDSGPSVTSAIDDARSAGENDEITVLRREFLRAGSGGLSRW